MDENQKKEFISYSQTASSTAKMLGLCAACLLCCFLCCLRSNPLFAVIWAGLGIFLICMEIRSHLKHRKYIRSIEESGEINAIVADFANADAYLDNHIKLGIHYVFCKDCKAVRYTQIGIAHHAVTKSRGMETNRFLVLKDRTGNQLAYAALKLNGKSNAELSLVMDHLKSRNPSIQLWKQPTR